MFGHGDAGEYVLTWLDRAGRTLQRLGKPFTLAVNPGVRLSPDDSRVLIPVSTDRRTVDLWMADLNRNTFSQFVSRASESGAWSSDGRTVLWGAKDGKRYLRAADGTG